MRHLRRRVKCAFLIGGSSRGIRLSLGIGVAGVAWVVATGAFGGSASDRASEVGTTQGVRAGVEAVATRAPEAGFAAYGKLPLSFVRNAGQLDRRVHYSAQAAGASFFFTRKEAVYSFPQNKKPSLALRLRFVGANRNVAIRGERLAPGRVNYLLGNDPSKWHTGLRTYQRVVYRNLWPGVDMAFAGRGGELKYEFLVRSGARVRDIRLAYRGAKRLSLDGAGNLLLRTPAGVRTDTRPASYQLVAGKRVPVRSSFALDRRGAGYGFALGRGYDRRYPLVIDPGLVYSTFIGGDGTSGIGIAVDRAGSAYVTGRTSSTNFPTTAGAFDRTYNGGYYDDAFVTKLSATGAALLYSTYLGGSGKDQGFGIAVDGAGSAYLTGDTDSEDFPTTARAFDRTLNGYDDAFVTKLDASGAGLVYSTYLGGENGDGGAGIALDGAGSAYVTGTTPSYEFPTTAGAFDTTYNGPYYDDAFVTKLSASGAALVYSTYLGGSNYAGGIGDDQGVGIALDGAGNAYLTGQTNSRNFPTTVGAFDTTYNEGDDAFVTKLSANGAGLFYSTYLGGRGYDRSRGIALDDAGSAYLTGLTGSQTGSPGFPTTAGAFDTTYNGGDYDAFVTKLDASGAVLVYSTYLGGSPNLGQSGDDQGFGIAVDGAGNAYLTGWTVSGDFPTTAGAFDTTWSEGHDGFVTKLGASGAALLYSTYLGGNGTSGVDIAVNGAGSAYLTGHAGLDFPTTAGAFDTTSNDGFVTKLMPTVRCLVPRVIGQTLARARTRIRRANCRVGRIRRAHSRRVGRVIAQRPRPGATRLRGARVNLVVGRR